MALLRTSRLVDEAKFAELFPDETDLPHDAQACANGLINRRLLTKYQVKMLLAGKSRGFFIGPYVIQKPVGQGGMGIVYLARHVTLDRSVALKVLANRQAQDQLSLDRFLREARAAAALDHPNIVRLYDIGQGAGVHYLVMEYVEGTNVHDMVAKTGPLHFVQAVQYIAQAAAGLHHAHEKGFVHRDIKPSNLMVTKAGVIKILDMGLARSVTDAKDNLTGQQAEAEINGTPDFISPEQLLCESSDARTDIYSLGATLFALMAGQPPYVGTTTQKMAQHQMKDPAELRRKLRGKAPIELADVVVKMMAKRKVDRYQSAEEVIAALTPWLPAEINGAAFQDPAPSRNLHRGELKPATHRTKKRKHAQQAAHAKKKWLMIGGSVGAILLVGVIALIASLGGKDDVSARANQGVTGPPVASAPARPADPPAIRGHTASINDVTFRGDGKVASVDWTGNLFVWDSNTGKQIVTTSIQSGSKCNACVSTPDNRHLVVVGDRMPVLVLDWETGKQIREHPGHEGTTWGVSVSPNGREFATCGNDGLVLVRDLTTGNEIRRFEFEARLVWSVAYSADGSKIAASCSTGPMPADSNIIRVFESATGKEIQRLVGHTRDVRWVTFHPDGQRLASAGFDGTVRLWDLPTGKIIRTIGAHSGYVERVAFLPGGKRLVSCGGLTNGQDGSLSVWDTDTGKEIRGWHGAAANGLLTVAVSSNGAMAATGSRDKIVRLWKIGD
ncbi:MAG TPA: serine/threonine-protein kinase [Gemmataceae bacterium]|nr:serine/threonine-protein kinase [Gemmataceae bacterium]